MRRSSYLTDPYAVLGTLREHYPCYRDWSGNRYWLTRYDDVTSVLRDDANFTTRTRSSHYDRRAGRDLRSEPAVVAAHAAAVDAAAPVLAAALVGRAVGAGERRAVRRRRAALRAPVW